jgi:hypothetical protein
MVFCNLGRQDKGMVSVVSIDETIQTAFEVDHVAVDADTGLEMFTALRHEFPQATIVTLSLAALLDAAHTSIQSVDE